jgi:uncharacterized protein (TIGR02996 family)
MLDDHNFIRVISAEPDDDGPRLLYADFLEEKGDAASLARAEFIRVQCALASANCDAAAAGPLHQREMAILNQHWRAWLRPACQALGELLPQGTGNRGPGAPRYAPYSLRWLPERAVHDHIIEQEATAGQPFFHSTQFRRGFLAHATLIHKQSRGELHVARLWDLAPIDGLSLLAYDTEALGKTITAIDGGVRLRSLEIGFSQVESVALIARSRKLASLRELYLRGILGEGDCGDVLGATTTLTNLQLLYVELCSVSDEAVIRLLESPVAQSLQRLLLVNCGITDRGAAALIRAIPATTRLKQLDLSGNALTAAGWRLVQSRFPNARPTRSQVPWPARVHLPDADQPAI